MTGEIGSQNSNARVLSLQSQPEELLELVIDIYEALSDTRLEQVS